MRRMTTAAVLAAITTMLPIAVSTTHAASTADDSAHIAAAVSTDHRPEPLQLSCEARLSDDVAGARCAWSAPTSDAAAGVELVRVAIGSDQGRQVVFRTTDLSVTEHVDTPIRAGVRYAYAVIAVNNVGRIVGRSRTVVTGVPAAEPPSVELLQLHCRAGSSEPTERNRVGCEWTLPTSPARALTLWRSVNDGARERVALFSTPFAASYGDVVSAGTTSVVYVVIATDGDGQSLPARGPLASTSSLHLRPCRRGRQPSSQFLCGAAPWLSRRGRPRQFPTRLGRTALTRSRSRGQRRSRRFPRRAILALTGAALTWFEQCEERATEHPSIPRCRRRAVTWAQRGSG